MDSELLLDMLHEIDEGPALSVKAMDFVDDLMRKAEASATVHLSPDQKSWLEDLTKRARSSI